MRARDDRERLDQHEEDERVDEPDHRPVDERLHRRVRAGRHDEQRHDHRDDEDERERADELRHVCGGTTFDVGLDGLRRHRARRADWFESFHFSLLGSRYPPSFAADVPHPACDRCAVRAAGGLRR